jgi:hypothetical protein
MTGVAVAPVGPVAPVFGRARLGFEGVAVTFGAGPLTGVVLCLRWSTTTGGSGAGLGCAPAAGLTGEPVVPAGAGAVGVELLLGGSAVVEALVCGAAAATELDGASAPPVAPAGMMAPSAPPVRGPPRLAAVSPPPARADNTARRARRRELLIGCVRPG